MTPSEIRSCLRSGEADTIKRNPDLTREQRIAALKSLLPDPENLLQLWLLLDELERLGLLGSDDATGGSSQLDLFGGRNA
jgi:hypothetical protein